MQTLKRAHDELFRRRPDENFKTMQELHEHCADQQRWSDVLWPHPGDMRPVSADGGLSLTLDAAQSFRLNSWSFGQLCQIAGVNRDTVNRLSPDTAERVFEETLPGGEKPLQVFKTGDEVRSVHGASYTRLHNTDLLSMVREFATDFVPPQESGQPGTEGGSGLYCGEQDMFVFLIDPTGWTEIDGEAFAPGLFIWNSEVGKRSVGIQTFWFQAVCQNHIVWDAVEVVEFSRKHTANVHDAVREIRTVIERLVERRDARRDGFASAISKAMRTKLGNDADDVLQVLSKQGITRQLGKKAFDIARESGGFTVFAIVDALTRLAGETKNAGDRTETDQKSARLLELAV